MSSPSSWPPSTVIRGAKSSSSTTCSSATVTRIENPHADAFRIATDHHAPGASRPGDLLLCTDGAPMGEPLAPGKWVVSMRPGSMNLARRGLRRTCAWYCMFSPADTVRAADSLFASICALGATPTPASEQPNTEDTHTMADSKNALAAINAALGLQPEASEASALAAVQALVSRADKAENALGLAHSQLADMTAVCDQAAAERDQLRAKVTTLEAHEREAGADAFVTRAVEHGKCTPDGATAAYFRKLYLKNPEAADETDHLASELEACPFDLGR